MTLSLVRGFHVVVAAASLLLINSSGALAASFSAGPISDISSACSGRTRRWSRPSIPRVATSTRCGWAARASASPARPTAATLRARRSRCPDRAPACVGPGHRGRAGWHRLRGVHGHQEQLHLPVVDASFDHGATVPAGELAAPAQDQKNWGDRDFIAVGPGRQRLSHLGLRAERRGRDVHLRAGGSCSFAAGDLNVVIQKSTDGGRSWGPMFQSARLPGERRRQRADAGRAERPDRRALPGLPVPTRRPTP